jgi:predicted P-loop ATPase/GTPase
MGEAIMNKKNEDQINPIEELNRLCYACIKAEKMKNLLDEDSESKHYNEEIAKHVSKSIDYVFQFLSTKTEDNMILISNDDLAGLMIESLSRSSSFALDPSNGYADAFKYENSNASFQYTDEKAIIRIKLNTDDNVNFILEFVFELFVKRILPIMMHKEWKKK